MSCLSPTTGARLALALLASSVLSCAATGASDEKRTETTLEELTVGEGRSSSGCSTAIVRGLTEQLVQEVDCLVPGAYRSIAGVPNVTLSPAARAAPYLHRDAAEALRRAAARGGSIQINSALRTLPQQYLLKKWAEAGRCGIRAAASPGRSNHESGLAIDVASASSHRSRLGAQGFRWAGGGDPPHFDYSGGQDLRSQTVRAFQRLWNRNNPRDRIAEDGDYGPATEARLRQAPADGFPLGASCGTVPAPSDPDAGGPEPDAAPAPDSGAPSPTGDVCDRGASCADCNAIAFECGFCASTGQCLRGDGSGPFSTSCGSGWQWMAPSSCPMTPDPDPDPDPDPAPDPAPDPDPEPAPDPEPMCAPVQSTLCAGGTSCCDSLECRRGVSFGTRCCAGASQSCSSGGDCCGYMDCISGTCRCRSSGRACLADGDCCSGSCRSGSCR